MAKQKEKPVLIGSSPEPAMEAPIPTVDGEGLSTSPSTPPTIFVLQSSMFGPHFFFDVAADSLEEGIVKTVEEFRQTLTHVGMK